MNKTIFFCTGFFSAALLLVSVKLPENYIARQSEIKAYSLSRHPALQPLQIECCRPGDETSTSTSYGARCVTGNQYCVANECPTGTAECGGTAKE